MHLSLLKTMDPTIIDLLLTSYKRGQPQSVQVQQLRIDVTMYRQKMKKKPLNDDSYYTYTG